MTAQAPSAGQLSLDLGHRPALGRDDLLVGPGNAEAVEWIDRWPAWPGHGLAVAGPAGCGKSHLAQVFAARARADVIVLSNLRAAAVPDILARSIFVAIENGDDTGSFDERGLFHLFNAVKEQGGSLLLTGREAPARWVVALPDLKSRLAAMPVVRIAPPDDATIQAVLVKLFADRQLAVTPDVVVYLSARMDRSFAAVRDMVARIDARAMAEQRAVTVPLVRDVLGTAPDPLKP